MVKIKQIPFIPKKKKRSRASAAPQGPILLSAVADFNESSATLTFDRAIEMGTYDPAEIVVSSAADQLYFVGNGSFDVMSPESLKLYIGPTDEYTGDANLLDAGNASGIRADEDDVAWMGVTDFVIGV